MYLTEIFGGMGKLSEPTPKGWSLYVNGLERIPDQATTPWSILTNGKLVYGDLQKSRFDLNLGEATVLTIPIPSNKDDPTYKLIRGKIEEFLDDNAPTGVPNIYNLFSLKDGRTGLEDAANVTSTDVAVKSWPIITDLGVKSFQDNKYQYYGTYERWFDAALDEMQLWFTENIVKPNKAMNYDIAAVGLGAVTAKDGTLTVVKAPGTQFEFFGNYHASMRLRLDRYKAPNMKMYMIYLMMLGEMLRRMAPVEGFTDIDYMAEADVIVAQNKLGDNNFEGRDKPYDMRDIKDSVRNMFGQGYNEAFPWNKTIPWRKYFAYQVVRAWVLNRISAQSDQYSISLTQGDKMNGLSKWIEYTQAPLSSIGSNGGLYLPMATNLTNGYLFLPMVCRKEIFNTLEYLPIKKRTFTSAELRRGEVSSDVFNPDTSQQEFIKLVLANDARKWEITYAEQGHVLVLFRFEIASSFDILTPNQAAILVIYTEFTGSASSLSEGYYVKAGADMLRLAVVSEKFSPVVATNQVLTKETDTHAPKNSMSTPQNINPTQSTPQSEDTPLAAIPSTTGEPKPSVPISNPDVAGGSNAGASNTGQ